MFFNAFFVSYTGLFLSVLLNAPKSVLFLCAVFTNSIKKIEKNPIFGKNIKIFQNGQEMKRIKKVFSHQEHTKISKNIAECVFSAFMFFA